MASLPRIPGFLGYLLSRKAHNAHDHQVAEELAWGADRSLPWPAGLEIEWLGTSGFRLRYQGFQLLIDPYLTRLPMGALLRRRVVPPSIESIRQHIDAADAILIGHTHFDHALDAPKIAELFDCQVYGSRSTANLMALYGQSERMQEVEHYKVYELGPFEVTFVPSVHSKLYMGMSVPYSGDVCCDHFDDLTPAAYKCGQVFGIHIRVAGTTFYHQGSADLIEEAIQHKDIDYFLAGIAGRGFTRDYASRILGCLQPKVVIPNHYDNFFLPLGDPMEFSTNVNLAGFVDDVEKVSTEFRVATLSPLQSVGGENRSA
jgi:L-ascorbate metabolism protein UlaG (beta-lactamase superfamily)